MKRLFLLPALAMLQLGCEDPVLEAKAEALGPDTGRYEEGPLHRAGFPCTYCHAEGGRTGPHFDLAGTIYSEHDSAEGIPDVTVRLFDRKGRQQTARTNEVGTFFFEEGELDLELPLWVQVEDGERIRRMKTPIYRERSCAACHRNPTSPSRRWQVYLGKDPE